MYLLMAPYFKIVINEGRPVPGVKSRMFHDELHFKLLIVYQHSGAVAGSFYQTEGDRCRYLNKSK